ncbi:MAG: crossover junction endodeoxyribonuclease RuvC [Candidatus Nealsonbacteria bacterium CG10_big_fil_rev_8_21_14_0_10_36_24]|uniref:Crossover junction endodeoxyribonuclease RuvC n=2 Tax=Candidatus Nealsoniibacteriota TaxID=1817911 RepID=A0A2H0YPH2_9BACT|nr:MAG: crossover junction endodeoxyribonuclease RuvC [Candidatus Nealsonbacteria bacterium CG10_big_fil_rev_8_21_14_0_10_36_24]PIS40387.1 MAG: crossover junction endodeoxyribonuclease RuvC [Candidatus Nealsonbacteria bacterium CG08_land_8_20_14_0_20_36_22]
MIICGIDPGTATTGFGIIRKTKKKLKVIDYGCIKTSPDLCAGDRLKIINNELNKLIKKHKPNILAVENIYFFKNFKTAMPVSQAKGVILLTAAKKKIPVYEITPLQMKMAITGYGKAEKKQVQEMLKVLLNLKEAPKSDDAADALGVALCCAFKLKIERA